MLVGDWYSHRNKEMILLPASHKVAWKFDIVHGFAVGD